MCCNGGQIKIILFLNSFSDGVLTAEVTFVKLEMSDLLRIMSLEVQKVSQLPAKIVTGDRT